MQINKYLLMQFVVIFSFVMAFAFASPISLNAFQTTGKDLANNSQTYLLNETQDTFYKVNIEEKISLDLKKASMSEALKAISRETGLKLTYRGIFDSDKNITIKDKKISIGKALSIILKGTNFDYKVSQEGYLLIHEVVKGNMEVFFQTVSGTVTDGGTGETIPGVNVVLKGTTTGTSTDSEGQYELDVPSLQDTLVFSFIGYQTQEVPINGRTQVDVELQPQAVTGEDVVVVGYGTQERADLTGSVGSVDSETFQLSNPTNVQQGLAGKISGVNVSQNSGRPGGRTTINIRGNSTVTGSNEPLYVVDGVVLPVADFGNGSSPIDFLDPNTIESIEVLKDASASAIYGSRGSNGVVMITTKSAEQGTQLTYSSSYSVGQLTNKQDMLDAKEYMELKETEFQNAAKFGVSPVDIPSEMRADTRFFDTEGNPKFDTDWQEVGTRTTFGTNQSLGLAGGDTETSYRLGLGFRRQEGLLLDSELDRWNASFGLDEQVNDWLDVGGKLNFSRQNSGQPRQVGAAGVTPTRNLLATVPGLPVRNEDGSFAISADFPSSVGLIQPLRLAAETEFRQESDNLVGNAYATIRLAEGLELRSTVSANIIEEDLKNFQASGLKFVSQTGDASLSSQRITTLIATNTLTYTTNPRENDEFTGLVGTSFEREESFGSSISVQNIADDFFEFNNLGAFSNINPPTSSSAKRLLSSYFGRLNYTLNNKYLFTFTTRLDGASVFGANNRYGLFPSGAIGWKMSEEEFMQPMEIISNLKLRASYGTTGSSDIPPFRNVARLGNAPVILNGTRVNGIGLATMANQDLQWEKTKQFDFGIDLGLFNDRVEFTFDLYWKKTLDMLLDAPVPASSGFSTVFQNIGSMRNKGVEFTLKTVNISTDELLWMTDFNLSANRNEIRRLTGGQDIIQGGAVLDQRIIREGESVNSFWGFINLGTWNTDQAAEAAKFGKLPGDRRFKDLNEDGVINDDDRTILGRGTPAFFGSIINTFNYKSFDMTLDLQFWLGNDVSYGSFATLLRRTGFSNSLSMIKNAWTPDNQDTDVQQIRPMGAVNQRDQSSSRIFDGSFLRGRNFTLGYRLPQSILEKVSLKNLRIYFSMQNFFQLTSYPGFDPEVSTSLDNFSQGTDVYSFPKPKTFSFGLNIQL